MAETDSQYSRTIIEDETIELSATLTLHIKDDHRNNRAIITTIKPNGTNELALQNGSLYVVLRNGECLLTEQIKKTDKVRFEIKHLLDKITNIEVY